MPVSRPRASEEARLRRAAVVVPALDEEETIAAVVEGLRRAGLATVVVVDNGSTDHTAERARAAGATVVPEPRRGYGAACRAGIASLPPGVDVVGFLDGDGADDPADLRDLLEELERTGADLVVGSRLRGAAEAGSLTWLQRQGNRAVATLLAWMLGGECTDLGPLRVIRRDALDRLALRSRAHGWTVEMQARAARLGLRVHERPVSYRRRAGGRSKISGTLVGSLRAGSTILWTLCAVRLRSP